MVEQTTVALVNQLTLAAAAIIACGVLWRAYSNSHLEHIKDLREFYNTRIFDLQARVMVLEDHAGVKRDERKKYLPPASDKEKEVLANLDK